MASSSYQALKSLHFSSPSFTPLIPTTSLPLIAGVTLSAAFVSSFYFTTLKRSPVQETITASVSSLLAGVGVVALFCAVGVNV
ncbi:hypothetical protein BDY24DRAFT_405127 [Mrakia frigida]|uniref:OST5 family protein n=1 Tax=Mrakia frigida TaxID=29902 RepID=UPI003FCBF7CE